MIKPTKLLIKLTTHKLAASSLWSAIIIYLSLGRMPTEEKFPFKIMYLDKFVHLTMYFILCTLLLFEYRLSNYPKRNIIIVFYTIFFGLAMEVFQSYIFTYRSGSFYDSLFNIIGSISAYIFFRYFSKVTEK
jgi:VanZ family protein